METRKVTRTCSKGHQFFKSSDCLTCPICEKEQKPVGGVFSALAAPARRALENHGIKTLKQLSTYSESEVLKLHGLGRSSIPKLQQLLSEKKLTYRK